MTLNEAIARLWDLSFVNTRAKVDTDDFNQDLAIAVSDKTCDGCIYKPQPQNKDNPRVYCNNKCITCSRLYSDNYERTRS